MQKIFRYKLQKKKEQEMKGIKMKASIYIKLKMLTEKSLLNSKN